jgi:hypothetical protein
MADGPVPLLHTVRGSAKRLGVSESTVWRLPRAKKLKPTRILGRTLVADAELQRLVHEAAEELGGRKEDLIRSRPAP